MEMGEKSKQFSILVIQLRADTQTLIHNQIQYIEVCMLTVDSTYIRNKLQ